MTDTNQPKTLKEKIAINAMASVLLIIMFTGIVTCWAWFQWTGIVFLFSTSATFVCGVLSGMWYRASNEGDESQPTQ